MALGVALCLAAAALAAPLPQAALQRAREAEKLFAAGQVEQAIAAYEKVDTEFPGHASLSLRLGQLYDLAGDTGAALFYYRRYAARSEGALREEAQARLTALELTPGAPEAAEKVAAKKKEKTAAVPPPKPPVRHSIVVQTADGVFRPLNSPQDVEKLARGEEIPAETPAPAVSLVTPGVPLTGQARPRGAAARPQPGASAGPSGAAGLSASAPSPGRGASAPARTSAAPAGGAGGSHASAPAAAGASVPMDEDAALAAAFARRSVGDSTPLLSPATTRTVIRLPDRRAEARLAPQTPAAEAARSLPLSTPATELNVADFAAARPSGTAAVPLERPLIEDAGPAPSLSLQALNQAMVPAHAAPTRPLVSAPVAVSETPAASRGFFTTKPIGGSSARLHLSNTVPNSLLSFAAIPEQGGSPINAVITTGESRTFNVPPGAYEIVVSAATNDYPPSPLIDRRFEQTFSAGVQYTRRLTQAFLQGME